MPKHRNKFIGSIEPFMSALETGLPVAFVYEGVLYELRKVKTLPKEKFKGSIAKIQGR